MITQIGLYLSEVSTGEIRGILITVLHLARRGEEVWDGELRCRIQVADAGLIVALVSGPSLCTLYLFPRHTSTIILASNIGTERPHVSLGR